jgi:hypothetical protein
MTSRSVPRVRWQMQCAEPGLAEQGQGVVRMHPIGIAGGAARGNHIINLAERRRAGGEGGRDDIVHGGSAVIWDFDS